MRYSNGELLDFLHEATERLDDTPTQREFDDFSAFPSSRTIKNRFGSWNRALRAAGLEINQTYNTGESVGRRYYRSVKERLFCANCGEERPPTLSFHHINPDEKSFSMARGNDRSAKNLYNEMKKCVVLCHNCHAIHHNDQHNLDAANLSQQDIPSPDDIS